ncbi:hypothetical protein NEIG_00399 [Nematocida sp. ERTm5]|nr:hypothetical protein NEIG_00399 [Nematocida sp. ERTm5]
MEEREGNKSINTIITHDGAFHLDDVLACFMLKKIYPHANIVRTRNEDTIKTGDIVVDVGGVFDPTNFKYDHHQRGFNQTYNDNYDIKMSSAGLVYKYHGMQFIKALGLDVQPDFDYLLLLGLLYETYFVSVDANDNGVDISDDVRYNERTLDNVIRSFVPFDIPEKESIEYGDKVRYEAFEKAMEYIGSDLVRHCKYLMHQINKDKMPILQSFNQMKDPRSRYIIMESGAYPVKELIQYYNTSLNRNVSIIIYKIRSREGTIYKLLCIPKKGIRYTPEIPLCEEWRGLRNEQMRRFPKLKNASFVHATGFCGAAMDLETAEYMAQKSIEEYLKKNA